MKKRILSMVLVVTLAVSLLTSLEVTKLPVMAADTTSGLISRWTFDNTLAESVNGLHATNGAAPITYEKGIYGNAAVFNGKSNYLQVAHDARLNLGNSFTISFWAYNQDAEGADYFYLQKGLEEQWYGDDYFSRPYEVSLRSGSEVQVRLNNNYQHDNPDYYQSGSTENIFNCVEGREWFLLTITYDKNVIKVYKDKELLKQVNYTEGVNTYNPHSLFIGVGVSNGEYEKYFKGLMDDLRFYNRPLSYDDVAQLYNEGLAANSQFVEPQKAMVAYYNFDNNMADYSGYGNNAQPVQVSGTHRYTYGKNGNAVEMKDGSYLVVPGSDSLNFDTEASFSFWVKLGKEGKYPILYRLNPAKGGNNSNDEVYKLSVDNYSSGNVESNFYTKLYEPSNWTYTSTELTSNYAYKNIKINLNQWFHVTYTIKDGLIKSYLNGVLMNQSEVAENTNLINASGNLLIGYDNSTFFNGALDELKIFNRELSPTEVQTEYNRRDSLEVPQTYVKKIAKLKKGTTATISSINFIDGDTKQKTVVKSSDSGVSFKSSNSAVVSVSSNGKLTAKKAGTAKISVSYKGIIVNYNVTVKTDSLSITSAQKKALTNLKVKKSYTISKITVKDGFTKKNSSVKSSSKNVTFTSSNKKIFTVTSNGKLVAKKKGTAKLTIKYYGATVTYTVKVK